MWPSSHRRIARTASKPSVMIPKFVSELRNLNHTRFSDLVSRSTLKFVDEFQGRDTCDPTELRARRRRMAMLAFPQIRTVFTAPRSGIGRDGAAGWRKR